MPKLDHRVSALRVGPVMTNEGGLSGQQETEPL
jgi:hypothetical protein